VVRFTTQKTDSDYTEPGMNLDIVTQKSISESNLLERFGSSDYQVLIAAKTAPRFTQSGWRLRATKYAPPG
jgi:hypothetical protein